MDKRFNPDCNTFVGIVEYYKKRAVQLLRFDYKLEAIIEKEWGAVAFFLDEQTNVYVSPYIYLSHRGKGIYEQFMIKHSYPTVLTSNDCGIEGYLTKKGFDFINVDIYKPYYKIISDYYGDTKAFRSGVPYINHIDEGLAVLKWMGLTEEQSGDVLAAYAYHPILQLDEDLRRNTLGMNELNHTSPLFVMSTASIVYTMEYRSVANEYLSNREIKSIDEIRISPLRQVNWMLIADKVQNRKDFELYHEGTHPNSDKLYKYFKNWLDRLEITEEKYQTWKNKLIIDPLIINS